ncbi:unnamed protein product [Peronospora belbahrii]|uniref:Trimethylguanosine synthase n=1 Tax=Peronospora belbahrii TaxID=622444 RepID=A0AAU9LNC8_9STRA|nr:unnamed protein product [Peronospora belbahrii]
MEVADLNGRASSRSTAGTLQVATKPSLSLELNGRYRSSSLDNERSWRPASGFASKHQADLETKCLHRERQMQRARQIEQMQDDKRNLDAELSKVRRSNKHVVLDESKRRTTISHGRRTRTNRGTAHENLSTILPSALGFNRHSMGSPSISVAVSAGCFLSQDEMENADMTKRKRRHQMKRRQQKPLTRVEGSTGTTDGVPHPSLLGEVMFVRRSSLQRLVDELHVDDIVTVQNGRKSKGNAQRRLPTSSCYPFDYSLRKAKSTSSMTTHQGNTKTYYHTESADSSPRGRGHQAGNRTKRRSFSRVDSPRSPRSESDSHGSPCNKKCVDEVAAFSVTDSEMATKISQAVLDLFVPSKDDITSESGNEDHEDGKRTIEERKKYPLVVTDGTACVGGNVLSFCDFFMHVNAIENDSTRVQMLRHNLQVLKKTNVTCMHANYLDVMLELQQDVVFLDPPWGGPEYKDLNKVDLFLADVPLHEICTRLQSSTKCIVLKVPSNFDDVKFSRYVPGNVIIRRDFKKMHLVLLDFR